MAEPESDPGFTVVDRRHRGEDAPGRDVGPAPPVSPSAPSEPFAPRGGRPRPDLPALCAMLYSEALVHLGQVPDPVAGQPQPDLEQARFTIDMLAMLQEKTAGNRTAEESAILDEILATLRMGFVALSRLA